jgi:Flp pilus assembly protein TadB
MHETLRLLPFLLAGPVIWQLLERLLPYLVCHFRSHLAVAFRPRKTAVDYSWTRHIPQPIAERLRKRLLEAGCLSNRLLAAYFLALTLPAPLGLMIGLSQSPPALLWFLAGALLSVCCNSLVYNRIQRRRRAFQLNLYKIYRFIDLQLTAGIHAMDVLKGLG